MFEEPKMISDFYSNKGEPMKSASFQRENSQQLDRQNQSTSADGITHPQEQQGQPDRLPKSLIEWLARINQRYLALERGKSSRPD